MSKFSPFICPVTGVTFHKDSVASVVEGDLITLVRDPENQFDPNAIAVYSKGSQLGFIPAALSSKLAVSRATSWEGFIDTIYDSHENRGLRIKITTEIGLPNTLEEEPRIVHSAAGRYLGTLMSVSGNKARILAKTGRVITYPTNVINISSN